MKRSRLLQIGAPGSKRRNFCQTVYMTGASAIGVPGWPELAAWTASMQSVRIVSIASLSMGSLSRAGKSVLAVWVMGPPSSVSDPALGRTQQLRMSETLSPQILRGKLGKGEALRRDESADKP